MSSDMGPRVSSLDLVDAVCAGEGRAIARMLSRAESGTVEARSALDLIYQHTGRAHVVGITGVPGVFVRSMATRGALGGLARGTLESVDVLDAAGYGVVIIETVGVGQDEV